MQKKMSQRDSFQKRSGFTSFFMVDKEDSKVVKLVLDYLWMGGNCNQLVVYLKNKEILTLGL